MLGTQEGCSPALRGCSRLKISDNETAVLESVRRLLIGSKQGCGPAV
jgi:hypothetical protein